MKCSPLREAASDLAQAAFELIGQLTADPEFSDATALFAAIRAFYITYHVAVGDDQRQDEESDIFAGASEVPPKAPSRFKTAIMVIEPGVFDPAAIARYILTACDEVTEEGGYPALDPAVRLMCSKLAWLCQVTASLRDTGGMMFDCTRHVIEGQ